MKKDVNFFIYIYSKFDCRNKNIILFYYRTESTEKYPCIKYEELIGIYITYLNLKYQYPREAYKTIDG